MSVREKALPEFPIEIDMDVSTTRAVSRAFQILEVLSREQQGIRLTDLSGLHKSTVFRLVRTLVELGYVQQARQRDLYALSPTKRSPIERCAAEVPGRMSAF